MVGVSQGAREKEQDAAAEGRVGERRVEVAVVAPPARATWVGASARRLFSHADFRLASPAFGYGGVPASRRVAQLSY